MTMKKLFILLILLISFLFSACSDDKERYVTIAIRGGNEFGSVSKMQIIRSFEGEEIDVTEFISADKEGRYTIKELFILEGSKLELRVFPGYKHDFDGFKGDLNSGNRIASLIVDGDKKVEVAFHFQSEILNEPKKDGNVYEINHSSHIRWIADKIINIEPDNFIGKTIKMTDDIYMDGIAFDGIASTGLGENYSFAGTFDGQGYTIHNINIDSIDKNNVGFIGNLANAGSVKNLSIKGKLSIGAGSYVGAVVGKGGTARPKIENVFSKVDMTVGASLIGACYVGGIAGGEVSISQSYNAGEIKLNANVSTLVAAGIVGRNGIVNNCYNTGQISGYSTANIAGIAGAGSTGNTIANSYNIGALILNSPEPGSKKGGIAINDYTLASCYFLSENGFNEGINALADTTPTPEAIKNTELFKFIQLFVGYDTTIWKMQSGLSAGNGDKNKVVASRPVLIGLGEGK